MAREKKTGICADFAKPLTNSATIYAKTKRKFRMTQPPNQKSGRLTTKEAAEVLGVSRSTIRNMIRDGALRGDKEPGPRDNRIRLLIPQEDVQALIDEDVDTAHMHDIAQRYTERVVEHLEKMKSANEQILEELTSIKELLQLSLNRQLKQLRKEDIEP